MTDPAVQQEAHSVLSSLFTNIGQHASGQSPGLNADWFLDQIQEFVDMPLDLANIFVQMATQLTEMVLKALEEAGIVLTKGLTPL